MYCINQHMFDNLLSEEEYIFFLSKKMSPIAENKLRAETEEAPGRAPPGARRGLTAPAQVGPPAPPELLDGPRRGHRGRRGGRRRRARPGVGVRCVFCKKEQATEYLVPKGEENLPGMRLINWCMKCEEGWSLIRERESLIREREVSLQQRKKNKIEKRHRDNNK